MNVSLSLRKNIIDYKVYDKRDMLRISIRKDGTTTIDLNQNQEGRGIYIKLDTVKNNLQIKKINHEINKKNGNFKSVEEQLKKLIEMKRGENEQGKTRL